MAEGDVKALQRPFERKWLEYYGDVPQVRDRPGWFIENYATLQTKRPFFGGRPFAISQHGATHPPGPILILWSAGELFGADVFAAAMTAIVLSSLAPGATWWLARRAAGGGGGSQRCAIAAVGLHVVSPGLVLFGATCMDGVFVAPMVASAAAMLAAYQARKWPITLAAAVGAGLLISLSVFLTFGAVCLAVFFAFEFLLNLADGRWKRRLAALGVGAAVVAGVYTSLWLTLRFDVMASLSSAMTRNDRAVGTGYETWSRYFDLSIAHVVAFIISAGLACSWLWLAGAGKSMVNALSRKRTDGVDHNALIVLMTMLVLAFSTLFTLEIERVWMWLIPFVLVAASIGISRRFATGGLIALAIAMLLQFAQTWVMQRHLYLYW
jgi:hypothetical protein